MHCAQLYSLAETPATPLLPHLGSNTRTLLVSQDRRHLFVTPCSQSFSSSNTKPVLLLPFFKFPSMFFITLPAAEILFSPFVISIFPLSLSPFFLLFYGIFILLYGFFSLFPTNSVLLLFSSSLPPCSLLLSLLLKFLSPFAIYFSPFPSLLFSNYFMIFLSSSMVFFPCLPPPPPPPSLHPALFFSNLPAHFLQCWNFAWQAHQPCGRISWQVRIKGKSDLVTSPEWFSVNLPWSSSPQARNFAIF